MSEAEAGGVPAAGPGEVEMNCSEISLRGPDASGGGGGGRGGCGEGNEVWRSNSAADDRPASASSFTCGGVEWEAVRTEDGTPYYHCRSTGQTQWERPT